MRSEAAANAVILAGAAALLGAALAFQFIGGLVPCEMCHWQRWALLAAIALGLLAWARGGARALVWLALAALFADTVIGVFHAGVEQKWWQGITRCAAAPLGGSGADVMADILSQPLVRCDAIPWSMFGISMAGWNAIVSAMIGGLALWLLARR